MAWNWYELMEYLASGSFSISEHMSKSRDNVDSEANQKSPNSRIDWAKEREDNSQEPDRYHNRQPCQRP